MSRKDCLCEAIVQYLNPDLRRLVVPNALNGVIPHGTTLADLALETVLKAEREDRLANLCQELRSANPNPDFHAAVDRCMGLDGVSPGGRPRWYDDRLPMKQPLIDREELRAGLYEMLETDAKNTRLMIVRGGHPGKSYCRWLIQHVAREVGLEPPVIIDLLQIASVQQLADRLLDLLGHPHRALEERFSTEIREGRYFNDWLVGQSRSFGSTKRWLIVFDHLAKPGVPQTVADTVVDLAQRAMEGLLKNVWIVLLDCPVVEPLDSMGLCYEETVGPLPRDAVASFVRWLAETRRQAGDPDPQTPSRVTDLLAGSFPLDKSQLRDLQHEIVAWLRRKPQSPSGDPR